MNAPPSPFCVLDKDTLREVIKAEVGPIAKFFGEIPPEGYNCTQQGKRIIFIRWYGRKDEEDRQLNRCIDMLRKRGYQVSIRNENSVVPRNHDQRRVQKRRMNRNFLKVQRPK